MGAPDAIRALVRRFEEHREAYRSGSYNETQLRREFLDPFFEALGWDVNNRQGYAEAYKEVIHEDAVKIGGQTKAPDYSFRIGGARKFFVEAKKPSISIKDDTAPAYQLRRYAWSAKLPLSILTDFDEFAVYDCRARPDLKDKPAVGRILYLTAADFETRWEEIAGVFSREAVLKGSFDKYAAAGAGAKRGTAGVDAAFLAEIEGWRDLLARSIALRNPDLSVEELNFAVQRTIDRLIFLRICEDRGIEDYGALLALVNGENVYGRLRELYRRADERYNSGLFHFHREKGRDEHPDTLTPRLAIDDKPLKEIIRGLYYPESPYEFSVLPADILGQVYEQFLGKVIRLTAGHRAVVEEKPEVKKAGGVYYTPTYIVDYIVRNTVGKLLEGKTPKSAAELRILDPACGSGSFLIGAYQHLLDWHRDWYAAHEPEKLAAGKHPPIHASPSRGEGQGEGDTRNWRLTTAERKRILLNNIYGVDIDSQAVEVTKLSLLLKVLEGENEQTLSRQLRIFHERALPDLGRNIKCGNSLIGPDFFDKPQLSIVPPLAKGGSGGIESSASDLTRINPFDWQAEFPDIMSPPSAKGGGGDLGGFDAVIGNPPYVRQESLSEFKPYFQTHYEAFNGIADLYVYFMEKGISLLRGGGLFSIIVSSSFLRASYAEPLRRTLKKHAAIRRIVDFGGLAVFENAKDTYVSIPLLEKGGKQSRVEVSKVQSLKNLNLNEHVATTQYTIPHGRLTHEAWSLTSDAEAGAFEKIMKAGKPLGDYVSRKMFYGIKTGLNEAFVLSPERRVALCKSSPATRSLIKPFLGGQDIRRYFVSDIEQYLVVIPCGWTRQQLNGGKAPTRVVPEREAWQWFSSEYRKLSEHLVSFAEALKKRQDKGDYWWELRPCDYYQYLDAAKIIFPDICKGPRFYLDTDGRYLANTAYCLGTDDRYLLGFLNSRLFWFAISHISIPFGVRAGEFRYRLIYQYMEKVPIRTIDFSNPADKRCHDEIVTLVERMLDLHKKLPAARTDQEKTALQRQIAETDRRIDRLVYDLYGLTEDEIAIVEGSR